MLSIREEGRLDSKGTNFRYRFFCFWWKKEVPAPVDAGTVLPGSIYWDGTVQNLSDGRMCNACLLHICWWTQCECNIAQPEIPEDDGKMTNTCWPEVVLVLRFYVFASQPSLATILWPKYPEISWVYSKIWAIFFVPKVVDLTKAWRPCQEAWTCGGNRLPCDPCDLPSVPLWVVPVNFGASFQGFLDTWKVPHRPLRLRGCPRNKDKKGWWMLFGKLHEAQHPTWSDGRKIRDNTSELMLFSGSDLGVFQSETLDPSLYPE